MDSSIFQAIDFEFWFLQTLAMLFTALLIPNLTVKGPFSALILVIALAFVNAHVWSAALFFEIPDELSLRTLVVLLSNGVIFWILVKLLPGVEVKGLLPALVAPLIFTGCSVLIGYYGKDIDWLAVGKWCLDQISSVRETLIAPSPTAGAK